MFRRGFFVSAAAIAVVSSPANEKVALMNTDQKPASIGCQRTIRMKNGDRKTYEFANRPVDQIPFSKCAWIPPVLEAKPMLIWNTAKVEDQAKQDKSDDEGDLEHCAYELDLPEDPNEKDIGCKCDNCRTDQRCLGM